jgi:hypothetical protein
MEFRHRTMARLLSRHDGTRYDIKVGRFLSIDHHENISVRAICSLLSVTAYQPPSSPLSRLVGHLDLDRPRIAAAIIGDKQTPAILRDVGVTLKPRRQSSAAGRYMPRAAIRAFSRFRLLDRLIMPPLDFLGWAAVGPNLHKRYAPSANCILIRINGRNTREPALARSDVNP